MKPVKGRRMARFIPVGERWWFFHGNLGLRCPGCLAPTLVRGDYCRADCVLRRDSLTRERRVRA